MNHTTELSIEQTLGDLATRVPAASRVLRSAGLDYCCHGQSTLAAACEEKGLNPTNLLEAIRKEPDTPATSWESKPLVAVIQHILDRDHAPLRRELPELHETRRRTHPQVPCMS